MIVVSNTSPILNLAAVGHLGLLEKLYGGVLIPLAVYNEIAGGAGLPVSNEVQTLEWIETIGVSNNLLVGGLGSELDRGEAEAIVLALEQRADLLLMDERRGRRVASRLGLRYVGVAGILIDAKHQQQILEVKPILDALIVRAGFWLDRNLYNRILQAAGE